MEIKTYKPVNYSPRKTSAALSVKMSIHLPQNTWHRISEICVFQ